jgi:proteasome assembly chaperone (PAC2) family protein
MLTVHHLPELRQPAVLCAVSGWSDAGQAATGALGYLLTKWSNQRFAEFESDQIYNYTVTRPATVRPSGGRRKLTWPDFAWFGLPVPHAERDLVVLLGPEPDLRWMEIRRAALDLIERLNGSMLLTFGGFYAQVPHTGATRLFGRAYDEVLVTKLRQMQLRDSDYQGPTGFLTALADGAEQRGLPTCGLWAAAPMYLQGTANPKLAAALLMTAERLLGADLGTTELQAAGRDLELRINQAMRDRPDFQKLVREMGPLADEAESSEQSAEPAEPPGELPSSEEVLRDLESYLKDLRGEHDS